MDTSIFGIRFGSNAELAPTGEELGVFLEQAKRPGGREQHGDDLATYSILLNDLASFHACQRQGAATLDYREKAFYGVLNQSQFINADLKQAVTQYKYHLHDLTALDFKKPSVFITAAEAELRNLNPKKNLDAPKIKRLHDMVEERKRTLANLRRRRAALVEELTLIALYIRGNLLKIGTRCRASIVILVELLLSRKEESRVIADIQELFKGQLRDALLQGPVSKKLLDAAKRDGAILSKEIAAFFRDDVYALTGLFEVIHDHVQEFARRIESGMAELERNRHSRDADSEAILVQLEKVLVGLVSAYHFELNLRPLRSETPHENIIKEKRNEMLSRLLDVLSRERRARMDRRTGGDRRKLQDPKFAGLQRRMVDNRRMGKSRRG